MVAFFTGKKMLNAGGACTLLIPLDLPLSLKLALNWHLF